MATHYVLVDFENVQPTNMKLPEGADFKVKVFLGKHQTKISLEMARDMQVLGTDAEYIQSEGKGKNALDFLIAYYIGRLTADCPDPCFHIVSKDGGFDALIKHLEERGIPCRRCSSVQAVEITESKKIPVSASLNGRVEAVVNDLMRRKSSRPGTVKTLRSSIRSRFANKLSDGELDEVLEALTANGVVVVDKTKVTYHLPHEA